MRAHSTICESHQGPYALESAWEVNVIVVPFGGFRIVWPIEWRAPPQKNDLRKPLAGWFGLRYRDYSLAFLLVHLRSRPNP